MTHPTATAAFAAIVGATSPGVSFAAPRTAPVMVAQAGVPPGQQCIADKMMAAAKSGKTLTPQDMQACMAGAQRPTPEQLKAGNEARQADIREKKAAADKISAGQGGQYGFIQQEIQRPDFGGKEDCTGVNDAFEQMRKLTGDVPDAVATRKAIDAKCPKP